MDVPKAINPLLDDNDLVGFNFMLENIVQKCKNLPKSFSFHQPVDGKKVKTYYDKVKIPMDLGTMELKCKKHQYLTVDSFFKDLEQIYRNSVTFNTEASLFTVKAREIYELGTQLTSEEKTSQDLKSYEANIQKTLDSVETESVMTGPSSAADLSERPSIEDDEDTMPYTFSGETLFQQQQEQAPNSASGDLLESLELSGDEEMGTELGITDMNIATDFKYFENKMDVDAQQRLFEEGEVQEEDRTLHLEFFQQPILGLEEVEGEESISGGYLEKSEELLSTSSMARDGQLHTDLAMSDSDEEGEDDGEDEDENPAFSQSKKPTVDELDFDTL